MGFLVNPDQTEFTYSHTASAVSNTWFAERLAVRNWLAVFAGFRFELKDVGRISETLYRIQSALE